jgi:precorrin-6B C5,15-methyltransferase / cobalt-precorrin-6B C5,C15-methyltransferase
MTAPWLAVVGIGEDGLSGLAEAARALIAASEVLVGGARHHAMVPHAAAERLTWETPLKRTVEAIAARRGRRVVVLATGDPLWYGVGVTLARRFAPEEMTILPQRGAFSLAAARLGWPLAECALLTVHGRPLDRFMLHVAPGARLLVLSADGGTPAAAADLLRRHGWGPSRLVALEHLDGAAERRVEGTAEGWAAPRVADLNTLAVECRPGPSARTLSRLAGLPDDSFESDGQLTKREVRAATLAALAPLPGESLWDIGAGSGSVAIEWLRAAPRASAIAIERQAARCAAIARNAAALGVPELRIVQGAAPAALDGLPAPDAAFVGGGISEAGLLERVWEALRPGGRLVANAVTVEGEARLLAWRACHGGTLSRIAVSRAGPVGGRLGWRPLMPVTQLAAAKT